MLYAVLCVVVDKETFTGENGLKQSLQRVHELHKKQILRLT